MSNDKQAVQTTRQDSGEQDTERAVLPRVDVFEDPSGITLLADLPGVPKDSLEIKVEGDTLWIEGTVQPLTPEGLEAVYAEVRVPRLRRRFTLSRELDASKVNANLKDGVLSGGATAICGASAALALSAVLPRSREQERFTLVVVVSVTALSTVAMLVYPLIAKALHLSPALAGLFLGGSIHDVAQVLGAGTLMGPAVADQAIVVKLLRISLLALIVMAVSVSSIGGRARPEDSTQARPPLLPGFLQAFIVFVALNSLGWIPPALQQGINDASRACLVVAIAALGVKTSLARLAGVGWRAFALLLIETAWLAAVVLAAAVAMRG